MYPMDEKQLDEDPAEDSVSHLDQLRLLNRGSGYRELHRREKRRGVGFTRSQQSQARRKGRRKAQKQARRKGRG